jgi:hypothetical protein
MVYRETEDEDWHKVHDGEKRTDTQPTSAEVSHGSLVRRLVNLLKYPISFSNEFEDTVTMDNSFRSDVAGDSILCIMYRVLEATTSLCYFLVMPNVYSESRPREPVQKMCNWLEI